MGFMSQLCNRLFTVIKHRMGSRALHLFLLALIVRLVYIYQQRRNPAFWMPLVDAEVFDRAASNWADSGEYERDGFFFHSFLYPFFLGIVYKVFAASVWGAKFIQAILGAFTCSLTYVLGRRTLGRHVGHSAGDRVGLTAGLVVAFYGPLFFVESDLVAEGVATCVVMGLLCLESVMSDKPSWTTFFAWGVISAIAIGLRASLLPFVIVATLWIGWRFYRSPVQRSDRAKISLLTPAACLVGALPVLTPIALVTHQETGRYAILPAAGGVNAYLGNSSDLCRTLTLRPGMKWNEMMGMAGKRATLWQRDQFFFDKTLEEIKTRPAVFLKNLVSKSHGWVISRELPRNLDLYLYRPFSFILSMTVWKYGGFGFPFGLLLPLAWMGAWYERKRIPHIWWAWLGTYSLVHILVFGSSRYRVLLVPVLAILAVLGAQSLWRLLTHDRWQPKTYGPVLVSIGLAVVMSMPQQRCEERVNYRAELEFLVAAGYESNNQLGMAEAYYHRALTAEPRYAEAHHMLAKLLGRQKRYQQALPHFEAAASTMSNAEVLNDWGQTLGAMGQLEASISVLHKGISMDPDHASLQNNTGTALALSGRIAEALPYFLAAQRLDPSSKTYEANVKRAQRMLDSRKVVQR